MKDSIPASARPPAEAPPATMSPAAVSPAAALPAAALPATASPDDAPARRATARQAPAGKAPGGKTPRGRSLRQCMSDLHIWAGLLLGWLLYAVFLTGSVSYFRDEISAWMRPDVPAQEAPADPVQVTGRMIGWLAERAPQAPQWGISLPSARSPGVNLFWLGDGPRALHGAAAGSAHRRTALAARDAGRRVLLPLPLQPALHVAHHGALDRGRGGHVHAGGDHQRHHHAQEDLCRVLHLPLGQGAALLAGCAQRTGRAGPALSPDDHLVRTGDADDALHALGCTDGLPDARTRCGSSR